MGLCSSPDSFQEKMSWLFIGLDTVRVYIDELLHVTKCSWTEHLSILEEIFTRLQMAGLKVNARKSCFGAQQFDHLGYHVTCDGVMPIPKKVEAIRALPVSKTCKQLCQFNGMINLYCDMWQKRSVILAPLTALTPKNVKYDLKEEHQKCFDAIKRVIGREVLWPTQTSMLRLKYILMLSTYKLAQSYPKRASPSLSIHERWTSPNRITPQLRKDSFP